MAAQACSTEPGWGEPRGRDPDARRDDVACRSDERRASTVTGALRSDRLAFAGVLAAAGILLAACAGPNGTAGGTTDGANDRDSPPRARVRSCRATATAPGSSTSATAANCTWSAAARVGRPSCSSREPGWPPMTGATSATRPTRPNRRRPTRRRSSPRPRGSPPPAPTTGRAPSRWRAARAGRRRCRSRPRASRVPPTSMRRSRPPRSRGRTCSSGTRWAG